MVNNNTSELTLRNFYGKNVKDQKRGRQGKEKFKVKERGKSKAGGESREV